MKPEKSITYVIATVLMILSFNSCNSNKPEATYNPYQYGISKLEYNNPGLLVDLDVGFKSDPMPMDFDGDGDYDLLISESGSYVESGVFYFENISGNVDLPVFRYRMKVSTERFRQGFDGMCFEVSKLNGHTHVLTPDRVNDQLLIYKDVPQNVFWDKNDMPVAASTHIKDTKYNSWKMIDFDHDGLFDLLCGLATRKSGSYLLFFKNSGTNENPDYMNPVKINNENGKPVGNHLRMETSLADFDKDGDIDFIAIGDFADFIYFENTGTPTKYRYTKGKNLTCNGEIIKMVSRYGEAVKATAIDWNKDGYTDLIAGDEDGKISFIKNTGKVKNGIPEFLPPVFFQQEAKFVDFGALTCPRVFDWDHDGKDDIISGNGLGSIGFIKNLGGDIPKWAAPQLLKADGKEIRILPRGANWGYTTIDVGFWNEDNLPDIIVNHHNGNVLWFENTGNPEHPALAEAKPIEVRWKGKPQKPDWVPGKAKENELLAPWRTSPLIMDFNKDGLNDLIMLDYEGYLAVYLRFKDSEGNLYLTGAQRNFIYESGEAVLLNQRKGSSNGRLKIAFADWDGDGLEDLIFSSKPAVDWMKNRGMKDGKMVLQYMGRAISRILMGHTNGPAVCDWNKDGIPDLLVGTETGAYFYWQRTSFNVTSTMTTSGQQKPANYKYFKR